MGNKETVIVAMSGGVDSSVAAGLLKEAGYGIVGATLKLNPCQDDENVRWCCTRGAEEQARGVAGVLDVPHYTIDASKDFEDLILKHAWEEYDRGRTPSPCVMCNRQIKFRLLLELADKLGAQKIATGHYARLAIDDKTNSPVLTRGRDPGKDQSYFLYDLTPDMLRRTLFPLGIFKKTEVRAIAKRMGFANAERPESQDACFVYTDGSFAEGLRIRFGGDVRKGDVIDPDGNKLGEHIGIHRYTVGQRKGLGIALGKKAYVSRIVADTATVVLADNVEAIKASTVNASNINWLGDQKPGEPFDCQAQIRYRHKAGYATATIEGDTLHVEFTKPQGAIAPGQALVVYDGDRVLGGGWID